MSGSAIICRIKTRDFPNADRLLLGLCLGNQVVVGLDTKNNDLVVFFSSELQLSEAYCQANNLMPIYDENGKKIGGGFFPPNRRVKVQRFRGERSEGYAAPISSLEYTGYDLSTLKEGMEFEELNGVPICNKFVTKATRQAGKKNRNTNRKELPTFPMHFDTEQFRYNASRIKTGSKIILTCKLHGSSGRYSHCLDKEEVKTNSVRRIFNWILRRPKQTRPAWKHLTGSRRVILEKRTPDAKGFYGNEQFRYDVIRPIEGQLRKGETVYYEIVGWATETLPIMPSVDTKVLKDKAFIKKYGRTMFYNYGCPQGTCRMYVYRITLSTVDGHQYDLPWDAVKERCEQLNLKHVPELVEPFIYDGDEEALRELVNQLVEGEDLIDPTHIREGVVIRSEKGLGVWCYKEKSYQFKMLEGILKEQESYVDLEEAS